MNREGREEEEELVDCMKGWSGRVQASNFLLIGK